MSLREWMVADAAAILTDTDEFAETVTYTPADGVTPPFAATGIFQRFAVDQMEMHILRDTISCTITHAALVAGGLTSPTEQTNSQDGDVITRVDIDGDDEAWTVTQAQPDAEMGVWELTLEKAVRVVP